MVGPKIKERPKFSKLGLVTPATLEGRGVEPEMADLLAVFANCGLSRSLHETYSVVINHLTRCQEDTGEDMSLPMDTTKILTFVGWMIKRDLKSRTMSTYISGLRMYHLAMGYNEPGLREPIVKLILKGKENWESVMRKISGGVRRFAVTITELKIIKKTAAERNLEP